MRSATLAIFLFAIPDVSAADLAPILQRLAAEAEKFRRFAPMVLSEETLEQRTAKAPGSENFDNHEVISVFGFSTSPDAPNALHEVRQVISADGKQVATREKARQAMTLGLRSADDKLKRRLLEALERNGLRGAVTDFGPVILLFSARRQRDYSFTWDGSRQLGAEPIEVVSYRQNGGDSGYTVFRGNASRRQPLRGQILVRTRDWVPLRITMTAVESAKGAKIQNDSTVEYVVHSIGCILPASVVHRELWDGKLTSENTFFYAPFRRLPAEGAPALP